MTIIVGASTAALIAWFFVRTDKDKRPDPKSLKSSIFPAALFFYALLLRVYFDISNRQVVVIALGAAAGYLLYIVYVVASGSLSTKRSWQKKGKRT